MAPITTLVDPLCTRDWRIYTIRQGGRVAYWAASALMQVIRTIFALVDAHKEAIPILVNFIFHSDDFWKVTGEGGPFGNKVWYIASCYLVDAEIPRFLPYGI